jgi:hypothetical protein
MNAKAGSWQVHMSSRIMVTQQKSGAALPASPMVGAKKLLTMHGSILSGLAL